MNSQSPALTRAVITGLGVLTQFNYDNSLWRRRPWFFKYLDDKRACIYTRRR